MIIDTSPDADVTLLSGRAACLKATNTLLIADLHLGKASTFRKAGIPIPEGSAQKDLARLEFLISNHTIRRLIVLGDLFHSPSGLSARVQEEFRDTRSRCPNTEIILVRGNHDRSIPKLKESFGIDCIVPNLSEPPFFFTHQSEHTSPRSQETLLTVAGHVHPTISINSPSGDRFTERCFLLEGDTLVLPAFGSFTGGHQINVHTANRAWVSRDDGVTEVTRLMKHTSQHRQ